MKLSVMKPLHASWLIKFYNYMISSAGREVCMKVIYNAVFKGINALPSLESCKDIDLLVENENLMNMITYDKISLDEQQPCLEKYKADGKPEWEDNLCNTFEHLNDESSDNESEARAKTL